MLTMNIYAIAIISLLLRYVQALKIDADCVDLKGKPGDCKRISECSQIANSYKLSLEKLKFCDQDKYIICCPKTFEQQSIDKSDDGEFLNREERNQISVEKCFEYQRRYDSECNKNISTTTDSEYYPHMALVGTLYANSTIEWKCGGILLSQKFVLVNSICLNSELNYVRLGLPHVQQQQQQQQYEIEQKQQNFIIRSQLVLVHPYFDNYNESNGIALIELNRPAKLNRFIIPSCLPYSNTSQFTKGKAISWSALSTHPSQPLNAHKLNLRRLNDNECQTMEDLSDENLRLVASQFCAGSSTGSIETCQDVSDGALFIKHPDPNFPCSLLLVGMPSFTEACGVGSRPTLYTKIRPFVNSIEKIIWKATAAGL